MKLLLADEIEAALDYPSLVEHLRLCHLEPKAKMASGDVLLDEPDGAGGNCMLTRAAWLQGKVIGVKTGPVIPANTARDLPSINTAVVLFHGETGLPICAMEGNPITYWKTAGDSALGARLMARNDARNLLVVGAGALAEADIAAMIAVRPSLERVTIWNRNTPRAEALATRAKNGGRPVSATTDLEAAVREADIIACATAATEPLIRGAWLKPGAHLSLAGSFQPEMCEADVEAVARSLVAVDWREGTLGKCGELNRAAEADVFDERDRTAFLGDLYEIAGRDDLRRSDEQITLFKNAGGGHLDLMTAEFVARRVGLIG